MGAGTRERRTRCDDERRVSAAAGPGGLLGGPCESTTPVGRNLSAPFSATSATPAQGEAAGGEGSCLKNVLGV